MIRNREEEEKRKKRGKNKEYEEEEEKKITATTIQIITINGMLLFSTSQTCFFYIEKPTREMENYYARSRISFFHSSSFQYCSCLFLSLSQLTLSSSSLSSILFFY